MTSAVTGSPHRPWVTAKTTSRTAAALAALMLIAVMSGCGASGTHPAAASSGPTAAATNAPTGDASPAGGCSLLSAADLSTAFGQPMTDTTVVGTLCTFDSADHVKGLALSTDRNSTAVYLQSEPGAEHVAGLGDDAFWLPNGTVYVRKGDRAFVLTAPGSVSLIDPSANEALKATLIGLAKLVAVKF